MFCPVVSETKTTRLRPVASFLLVLVLLVAGCSSTSTVESTDDGQREAATTAPDASGRDPEPTATPEPAPTTAPKAEPEDEPMVETDPSDVAAGTAEVVLLDAGAEPRQELRLVIAPTCGEILTMSQVQDLTQSINGDPQPAAGPVGNVMTMSTSAIRSGDNYEVRSKITNAEAAPGTAPAMADALNTELSRIVGLTTVATITDRGVLVPGSSRVEGGEALGPMAAMTESISQLQAPLPLAAVGVGARWQTTSVIDFQGMRLANITETEVVSIDGTIVELAITGRQDVELGSTMSLPGVEATVTQWDTTTTGTTTIDLATISPIVSEATTEAVQQLDFGSGLSGGVLDQEISTQISTMGAPDDGCTGRSIRS